MQRALAAEEPGSRALAQPGDGAELVGALRATRELSDDIDVVGDIDVDHGAGLGIAPFRHGDAGLGEDARGMPNPAHRAFIPDAHIEDVIAAQALLLPPMERGIEIGKF